MSTISSNLSTPPDNFSTTLSSGIGSSDLSIPLNSVSGLPTEGVGVIFTKDTNGDVVAGSVEIIHWTGIGGSSLTLTNTGDRGLTGSDAGAQAYSAGAYFEVWVTSYYYDSLLNGTALNVTLAGTQTVTGDKTFSGAVTASGTNLLSGATTAKLNAPQGFLINGKIVVTDAAGITVAIKTLAGTDPSATDPVYCRIGDTVRTISAALSVAKADGTNWCNAGSAELATKEIDYFVYLGYNATDGVTIGFSRIPGANQYSDFSATTTNEKYCAISTITNAAATDYYENVGRFAATLSAGAGYTWSVPTYTAANLIQRPIYETRWLSWTPVRAVASGTAPTYTATDQNRYKIIGNNLFHSTQAENASGGTAGNGANPMTCTLPFAVSASSYVQFRTNLGSGLSQESAGTIALVTLTAATASSIYLIQTSGVGIAGNDQSSTARYQWYSGSYEI